MIASKLIFQYSGGLLAMSCCMGGGYYAFKSPTTAFYLVSATTEETNKPALDLYGTTSSTVVSSPATSSSNGTGGAGAGALFLTSDSNTKPSELVKNTEPKNYKCVSSNTEANENKECILYSLTFPATKAIDLSTIKAFINSTDENQSLKATKTQSEIKANTFFLLKSSNSLYKALTFDGTQQIKLNPTIKDSTTPSKSYATLNIHAKFLGEEIQGNTNLAIYKAISVETTSNSITTAFNKCKFNGEEDSELKDCTLQIMSNYPSTTTAVSFSSLTLPTTQTHITITKDLFYLIKWEATKRHDFSTLQRKNVIVLKVNGTTNANNKQTAKLNIESPLIYLPATQTTTFEQVVILK